MIGNVTHARLAVQGTGPRVRTPQEREVRKRQKRGYALTSGLRRWMDGHFHRNGEAGVSAALAAPMLMEGLGKGGSGPLGWAGHDALLADPSAVFDLVRSSVDASCGVVHAHAASWPRLDRGLAESASMVDGMDTQPLDLQLWRELLLVGGSLQEAADGTRGRWHGAGLRSGADPHDMVAPLSAFGEHCCSLAATVTKVARRTSKDRRKACDAAGQDYLPLSCCSCEGVSMGFGSDQNVPRGNSYAGVSDLPLVAAAEQFRAELSDQFVDLVARYSKMMVRSGKHQVVNLLLEMALSELALALIRGQLGAFLAGAAATRPRCDVVVDAGGGNGILSWLLKCRQPSHEAVVVDRALPPIYMEQAEAKDDPFFRRVRKDVGDLVWADDIRYPAENTMVVAKHLCGAGVDELLRSMSEQNHWPQWICVSTCCHFRSSPHQYINPSYLRDMLKCASREEFLMLTSRTSWLQPELDGGLFRTGAEVERLLDYGRVLWLRQHGYAAVRVQVAHPSVTPRGSLLLGVRRGARGLLK